MIKLTAFLLFAGCIQLSAKGWAQQITLREQDAPLEKVIRDIQKQSDYAFFYDRQLLQKSRPVTLTITGEPLTQVLRQIFKSQPLTYEIIGNKIITLKEKSIGKDAGMGLSLRDTVHTIRGKVSDEKGDPVIGASIRIKNSNKGTVTDAEGHYTLQVPDNAVLEVSSLGYEKKEAAVNGLSVINISLTPSTTGLNQLVVVGYGTQKKATLAGAVGVIDSKSLASKPVTNVLNAIQGVLPGLLVTRSSGRPGAEGYDFQIRGISSINNGSPLVIVDGVPNPLFTLDPSNIENITVLKDASAAIYGARAANGVILITTKKGKVGKLTVSYSGNFAFKQPDYLKKKVTTLQWAEMYNEAAVNAGRALVFTDEDLEKMREGDPDPDPGGNKVIKGYPQFYTNTDWNKILYGTGFQQYHNINVSGGSGKSVYRLSAGYFKTAGIYNIGNDASTRYDIRFNSTYHLTDRLTLQAIASYQEQDVNEPSMLYGSQTFVALSDALKMFPFVPEKTPDGKYYQFQGYANPAQELDEGGRYNSSEDMIIGNVKLTYNIMEGLNIIGQAGITRRRTDNSEYFRTMTTYNWDGSLNSKPMNVPNSASYGSSSSWDKSYTAYLDYNHLFADRHEVKIMAGISRETYNYQGRNTSGQNFSDNDIFTLNLADPTLLSASGSAFAWALNSFFSRISYIYDNKYILEATTRLDGSSRFAPDKRWSALFPSISTAWRLSEEPFIKQLGFFDNLKLRLSWGQTGNQDINGLGYYDYIQLINIGGHYPFGNGTKTPAASLAGMASPDRTWETVAMENIGMDVSILQSRLNLSFDYFRKHNDNMLLSVTLPTVLGAAPPTTNSGKLRTRGWELSVGWADKIKSFDYSIKASVSDNQNKLIYVGGNDAVNTGLVRTRQGYPMNSYFGYVFDGIIQNQKQLDDYKKLKGVPGNIAIGDAMYKDLDGDGTISAFGDPSKGLKGDLAYLGTPAPRYSYALQLNAGWRGFDAAVYFQGVGKRTIIRSDDVFYYPFIRYWAPPLGYFYDRTWSADRTNAKYPRLSLDNNTNNWNYQPSTNQTVNTAYLRLKNIQIGYTLPKNIINRIKLSAARVYVSGDDLWTYSKGTWGGSYDPEEGADAYSYPFFRTYSLGLDLTF